MKDSSVKGYCDTDKRTHSKPTHIATDYAYTTATTGQQDPKMKSNT